MDVGLVWADGGRNALTAHFCRASTHTCVVWRHTAAFATMILLLWFGQIHLRAAQTHRMHSLREGSGRRHVKGSRIRAADGKEAKWASGVLQRKSDTVGQKISPCDQQL